jgi:hypothetical protein
MVQKETFQREPYSRFILNQSQPPMKNTSTNIQRESDPASVAGQLLRVESALGADWMVRLEVAPETVRTWKKRGAVPVAKLVKAAELSGRPLEWFKTNQSSTEVTPPSFFPDREKQVIREQQRHYNVAPVQAINVNLLQRVLLLVETELEEMRLTLPSPKKAQLVALLYQRFEEQKATTNGVSELESVRQYLRLVA